MLLQTDKLTKPLSDQLIKEGRKPYCVLSREPTKEEDWGELYTQSFMSGGFVDGFLEERHPENPFPFEVYFTNNEGNWYGGDRAYYRTARPVTKTKAACKQVDEMYFKIV